MVQYVVKTNIFTMRSLNNELKSRTKVAPSFFRSNVLNIYLTNSTIVEFTGHSQRFPIPSLDTFKAGSITKRKEKDTEARKNPKQGSSPMFAERNKERKGGKRIERGQK